MKLAIFADAHLGFGTGTEREEESYTALSEVLTKCLDCDAILIAGDLFDSRTPTTDSLARAMEILLRSVLAKSQTKILAGIGRDVEDIRSCIRGIPVIAIAGTHERRVRGLINPIQALERAGFLIFLHCNGVIIEKGGERVAVQGMSGVPEGWAGSVLAEWAPKPVEGCLNILLLHQSIEGIVPGLTTIKLTDLPDGFDLYVCGHSHERVERALHKGRLIIPGSLITTQLTKEGTQPRGFFTVDNGRIEWHVLESQRPIFWFYCPKPDDIEMAISSTNKKPIIRIEGLRREQEAELMARFENRAILSFKRVEEKVKPLSMEEHRLCVTELGQNLIKQNFEQEGLDPKFWEQMFELLAEGRLDQAQQLIEKLK